MGLEKTTKIMGISFITNFFLSLMKVVIGFIGRSSALIADGIHSFSDLVTDIVAILGNYLSRKPEDEEHPYGHGRLEYLTSILIGIVILFLGLALIGRVSSSQTMIPSKIVIMVSILTIGIKYLLSDYLIRKGKTLENQIILASGKESKADVFSSVIVLVSSILMQFEANFHPLIYTDKIASIIVGVFIVKTGFTILKENMIILIGSQEVDTDYYKEIERLILSNKDVKTLDKLIIMKYGYYYTMTIEVSMDASLSLQEAHNQVEKIESSLRKKDERAKYIHIHMNPYQKHTD